MSKRRQRYTRRNKPTSQEPARMGWTRNKDSISDADEIRMAVQTHLDGDSKPRPEEIRKWNEVRIQQKQEEVLGLILVPNEEQKDEPFPGYDPHAWKISEREGKIVCEPENAIFEITDKEGKIVTATSVPEKLAEDGLELKQGVVDGEERIWIEPTKEVQIEEFNRRYDKAVELATAADNDPTPERYFALLGYYEEFAGWLEEDVKLWNSSEHILKIRGLNSLLLERVDDRLRSLQAKKQLSEEEEGELRGWQRLHEVIHTPKPLQPPPPMPTATLHTGWEATVDLQDEMIRFWYTRLGHAYANAFGNSLIKTSTADSMTEEETRNLLRKPGVSDLLWAKHLDRIQRAALQSANPMWVSSDMQKLIYAAALHPSFRIEPLRREDVYPNMYGFALFPEPFYVLDVSNNWLGFRAISWTPYGRDGRIAYDTSTGPRIHPEDAGGLLVTGYTHRHDPDDIPILTDDWADERVIKKSELPIMSLCYVTPWGFDHDTPPVDMNGSGLNDFCKIVQTMWRFARQKVSAPETVRLPRAFRKRAERTGLQSDVIVVKLRQHKPRKHKDEEAAKAYELSVRFMVGAATGGFWRDQWYPKEKVHRQIWIEPFMKGPEGAPLIVKPLRAYELTR